MLTEHYRLTCDAPGCKAALLSKPLDFGGSELQLLEFYRVAVLKDWGRSSPGLNAAGNDRPARHYCPRHTGAGSGTLIF